MENIKITVDGKEYVGSSVDTYIYNLISNNSENSDSLSESLNGLITLVSQNSANWGMSTTTTTTTTTINNVVSGNNEVGGLSANWENTYTTVQSNSANWDDTRTTVQTNSSTWGGSSSLYTEELIEVVNTDSSSVSSVETTISLSAYDLIKIVGVGFSPGTDGADLGLQFRTSGTWKTTGYSYGNRLLTDAGGLSIENSGNASSIILASNLGTATGEGTTFDITIQNGTVTPYPLVMGQSVTINAGATMVSRWIGGALENTAKVITNLRLTFSTGNVNAGVLYISGARFS